MRILLVEDEKRLSDAIVHLLKRNNHLVDAVYDGESGYDYIMSDIYDVVILDVMLPKMNGFDVLQKTRQENNQVPIIMLTARSQVEDKVQGLDYGADDYLAKPFETVELLARLRALGRRKATEMVQENFVLGDIEFNQRTLKLNGPSKNVVLSHLESELFMLLYNNQNIITSKETIIVKLWGYDSDAEDNNVEVYISFLRKKLRYVSKNVGIKTTRGVGYSLEVTNV